MSRRPESPGQGSDSAVDSKTLDPAGLGPGWVNVVRAWPVPVLGNTKAAFSLWVGRGGLGDRQTRQRPMACGTRTQAPTGSCLCRPQAPRSSGNRAPSLLRRQLVGREGSSRAWALLGGGEWRALGVEAGTVSAQCRLAPFLEQKFLP